MAFVGRWSPPFLLGANSGDWFVEVTTLPGQSTPVNCSISLLSVTNKEFFNTAILWSSPADGHPLRQLELLSSGGEIFRAVGVIFRAVVLQGVVIGECQTYYYVCILGSENSEAASH